MKLNVEDSLGTTQLFPATPTASPLKSWLLLSPQWTTEVYWDVCGNFCLVLNVMTDWSMFVFSLLPASSPVLFLPHCFWAVERVELKTVGSADMSGH